MTRVLHLFTALVAAALLLATCGGQPTAEEVPEPTEAPTAEAPESEATEAETTAPTEAATESAADAAKAEHYPITVIDMLDREFTFDAPPERVVALDTVTYGSLAALGIRPVAQRTSPDQLGDDVYFLEDGESIPSAHDADGGINLELVAAAEPDLILVFSQEQVNQMSDIAPIFAAQGAWNDMEKLEIYQRKLGQVFNREAEANAAIQGFQDALVAYEQIAPEEKPSVVRIGVFDDGTVWPLLGVLCTIVFNTVASCDYGGIEFDGPVALESVLELDPDVLIFSNWQRNLSDEELLNMMEQNPLWSELTAVQNDRVIVPENYTNPNLASFQDAQKVLDRLVPLIYPDLLPDGPLTDEQVQEILAEQ